MTPEGKVKAEIKKLLDFYKPDLYYEMNVPTGYGKSGLDFIGIYLGAGFAIEAKRTGKEPSLRQEGTREDITKAGGKVFVIAGEGQTGPLREWLERLKARRASFLLAQQPQR